MEFTSGQTVFRDRRALIPDPYNPGRQIRGGDWDPELSIEIPVAFLGPTSKSALAAPTRAQIETRESLYSTNPAVDVIAKDRIRLGGTLEDLDSGEVKGYAEAPGSAPINPFTGWQPVVEILLTLTEG